MQDLLVFNIVTVVKCRTIRLCRRPVSFSNSMYLFISSRKLCAINIREVLGIGPWFPAQEVLSCLYLSVLISSTAVPVSRAGRSISSCR
jgi:hypothetical protein